MIASGRKFWGFTILVGGALAALLGAGLLRRPQSASVPALPTAVREAVKRQALEWRSAASVIGFAAGTQLAWLDSEDAVQDDARLIEFCDNLTAAGAALVDDFRRRAALAAGLGVNVDLVDVENFFRQTLREILPRGPEGGEGQEDYFLQLRAVPLHSFVLSAPAMAPPNPVLQRILERLLQVLTRLLEFLPPGSPAVAAVQRAIDAILALLGTADTESITITFTAPAEGAIINALPGITFEMRDNSSGPDSDSRQLIASSTSPTPQNVDLTPFSKVLLNDTSTRLVRIGTQAIPTDTLADGFLTFTASGTDIAGNPRTTATRSAVMDRLPPAVGLSSPANGAEYPLAVPIDVVVVDEVTGVDESRLKVLLNGGDITANLSRVISDSNVLGFPRRIQISGTANAIEGANTLSLECADKAGNSSRATVAFVGKAPPLGIPLPPANVTAQADLSGITVTWTGSLGATSYTVNRGLSSVGPFDLLADGVASLSLRDFDVTEGGTYYYVVLAANANGQSAPSSVSSATFIGGSFIVPLAIEVVSGSGQVALTGTCVEDDLVVRVYNYKSGEPVPGVSVFFSDRSGGHPVASGEGSPVTDASGLARAGWLASNIPGFADVVASVEEAIPSSTSGAGSLFGPSPKMSALFTIETKPATMADVTVRGPNNLCGFQLEEFPGSALSRFITLRARDHNGDPIKGETVLPRIVEFEGVEPTLDIGRFYPTYAVTDGDGDATFAFVISHSILPDQSKPVPGRFVMEFYLPYQKKSVTEHVSLKLPGRVRHPSERLTPAEIEYDDPPISGQGQIGIPNGRRLAFPFRVKGHNAVKFYIIEGAGTLEAGPEASGTFTAGADECGAYFQFNTDIGPDDKERASVWFTPSTDRALVAIDGVTDVLVVTPPQVNLVAKATPHLPLPLIAPLGMRTTPGSPAIDLESGGFLLEAWMPANYQGSVRGEIKSLDRCGKPSSLTGTLGSVVISNRELLRVDTQDTQKAVYRTAIDAPFVGVEGPAGIEGVPSVPANALAVALEVRGSVSSSVSIQDVPRTYTGPSRHVMRLFNEVVYRLAPTREVGAVHDQFVSKFETVQILPATDKTLRFRGYRWTITLPGATPTTFITLGDKLFFKLVTTGNNDVADELGKGENELKPILLRVNNVSRREMQSVLVEALDVDGKIWPKFPARSDQWLLTPGGKIGTPVPVAPPDGLLISQPTLLGLAPAQFVIQNQGLLTPFAQFDADEQRRIREIYGVANPFAADKVTSVHQRYEGSPTHNALAVFHHTYTLSATQAFVAKGLGVGFFTPAVLQHLDLEDLNATMGHEVTHVKQHFAARGLVFPGMAPEDTEIGGLIRDLYLFVAKNGVGQPDAVKKRYELAANNFVVFLGELDAEYREIVEIAPRHAGQAINETASFWYLRDAAGNMRVRHPLMMQSLAKGYVVKLPVQGDVVVKIDDPALRRRLIAYLRRLYTKLPDHVGVFQMIDPAEIDLKGANPKILPGHISLPKEEP